MIRTRLQFAFVAAALLLLVSVEGCICETSGVNRGDINLISLDREWQLGERLAAEILQQTRPVRDPVVQSYIEQMGERMAANTELSDRPWNFHVIADTSVNAFNIPGGHVFINTGLIAAAETPSELAGVVAHEVAHGTARHGTEQMTKAYGLNLIMRLVTGGEVNILEQIVGRILGSGAMAKFSRDDEREADALGLKYMAEAGYDPQGMAGMFETLLALRQRRPNLLERFISTHPLTEERIEEMNRQAADMQTADGSIARDEFARVQSRITRTPF